MAFSGLGSTLLTVLLASKKKSSIYVDLQRKFKNEYKILLRKFIKIVRLSGDTRIVLQVIQIGQSPQKIGSFPPMLEGDRPIDYF